jgi:fructose-bisphosphate aldolase class II
MRTNADIMRNAYAQGIVIPAFNIAHLPMVEPIVRAVVDQDSFALVEVSRIDWMKFGAQSPAAVAEEFAKHSAPDHVRLHLDHVPVIDEDGLRVDYLPIFRDALALGYGSVMIDGSRLPLEENIAATREVAEMAHEAGVPCEAELGAVMGHEAGPLPPYEELFASGKGFTDVAEAERFVRETGCDWLSVAVGSIHGAISGAARDQKKVEARLNLEHLQKLRDATGIPLVLHGGSGVKQEAVLAAIQRGIAKVNVGTEIRQVFESTQRETGSLHAAQEALYERTAWFIRDYFRVEGSRAKVAQ